MGFLTPRFVPGGGFLYTMIVPGGGFLPPSSRVPGVCPGGGWFWMKLITALTASVSQDLTLIRIVSMPVLFKEIFGRPKVA